MAGLDKKKVTEYLNRVTHQIDKDGRILPFQITWNMAEGEKYDGLTRDEKKAVCEMFLNVPDTLLFSDVCDIREFPVLLKDAVYSEKRHLGKLIPKKDIAPQIDQKTIKDNDSFNDAFLQFMAQRDEMVKPKEPAPLQLDVNGFSEDENEYGDYETAFSKEAIYTSQVFEVKPKDAPVSYEDAMKRYQNEIANPGGVSVSMTEAEAAAEFNRLMKEKQDAFDAQKGLYSEKIGDNIAELAKARDAAFIVPNYSEEERKKVFESMMREQEEMKQRIQQQKEIHLKFMESSSTGSRGLSGIPFVNSEKDAE
jgi:hypothetical protein